ncbi:MAG: hypothetical protein QUU85_08795, partial [Candidatus Eisenbacteria bacterium]|nr:hypothetical protein [Candidatus Eisenbacteria bacterium]
MLAPVGSASLSAVSRRHRFSSSLAVAAGFAVLLPDGSPPLAARRGPERPPAAPRNIVLCLLYTSDA